MKLLDKLSVWYNSRLIKRRLKKESERLREFGKFAPIPASVFTPQNILAHYGNPNTVGMAYGLNIVDGVPHQEEKQILTESAKVRFPDGTIELVQLVYIRDHAPWEVKQ